MKTRPPIYTKYYDLLGLILDRTAKFPKNMRFGIVQKIDGIALDGRNGRVGIANAIQRGTAGDLVWVESERERKSWLKSVDPQSQIGLF